MTVAHRWKRLAAEFWRSLDESPSARPIRVAPLADRSPRRGVVELFVERARDSGVAVQLVAAGQVDATVDRLIDARGDHRTVVERATLGVATAGSLVVTEPRAIGRDRDATRLANPHAPHVCVLDVAHVVLGVPEAVALLDPHGHHRWVRGARAEPDLELDRVLVREESDLRVLLVA